MSCLKKGREKKFYRGILAIAIILLVAMLFVPGISSAAYITSSDPDSGEEDVPVETWIIIRFNTTMDKASVEENLEISPDLDPYGYRLDWDNDGTELTIKPNAALVYDRNYTVSFSGAEDVDGNRLEAPLFIYFETEFTFLILTNLYKYNLFFILGNGK